MTLHRLAALLAVYVLLGTTIAAAQMPSGPPAVGVVRATKQAITETSEFIGRVQAVDRVVLTARVTAFLDQRLFIEGTEVHEGRPAVPAGARTVRGSGGRSRRPRSPMPARDWRMPTSSLRAPVAAEHAGRPALHVDDATANQRSQAAQLMSAQAQLRMAQINLAYTEIHAPISGKISRTAISVGNVVSPSSGPLASIVSQDPMYVQFPIAVRRGTGPGEALRRPGRHERRGDPAATAGRVDVRPDGQDRLCRAHRAGDDRHNPGARQIANPPLQADRGGSAGGSTADRRRVRHRRWSRASNRSWRSPFRARPCCPTSRATTSTWWTAKTRWSSAGCSWASPRQPPPWSPSG